MRKILLALAVSLTVTVAACGPDSNTEPPVADDTVLIDVRTPAEYEAGYLEGAINLDFYAPDFAERISELPKDDTYVLYCRSGNRSGQAKIIMEELGFSNVTNAGGYDDLR